MAYTTATQFDDWSSLECHEFCLAFPEMSAERFEELKKDITGQGLLHAIVLYEGKILDGRHRHRACIETGVEPFFEEFTGPGSAYDYVISENLKRRDLTPAQRIDVSSKLIEIMRQRAKARQAAAGPAVGRGVKTGLGKFAQTDHDNVVTFPTENAPVRDELAKAAGVSPRTASDAMTIKERGTPDDWNAVTSGKASISGKAKEVRQREMVERAKPKPAEYVTLDSWKQAGTGERAKLLQTRGTATFNQQDSESIGWAKWSWNPVTGCKHNCPYCYARDIAHRFYPQGFVPSLIPSRLSAPQNQKPRTHLVDTDPAERNVFTCSMADLFGKWVPDDWIDAVMGAVQAAPKWNFLFLTKFPLRMVGRAAVPQNAWLGTSVDMQARVSAAEEAFAQVPAHTRWLSIEPLIEPLTFKRPDLFQWVVIGGASASSQTPAWQPPFEWVARLYLQFKEAGAAVYIKDNIGFNGPTRPKEYPWRDSDLIIAPPSLRYLKTAGAA